MPVLHPGEEEVCVDGGGFTEMEEDAGDGEDKREGEREGSDG
jgi:hypothetical protein